MFFNKENQIIDCKWEKSDYLNMTLKLKMYSRSYIYMYLIIIIYSVARISGLKCQH